ncbi:MAG: hypothetical protein QW175_07415 [Candidatus Bathyarchaeia archaeon]
MSEAPPVAMLELFRGTLKVHAGDFDNWEGWNPSADATVENDGDFLKLIIGSGATNVAVTKLLTAFSAGTYKYANIRVTELTGSQFDFIVRRADTQTWIDIASFTSAGIKENIDIAQVYSGDIDGVGIRVWGSSGQYVVIDYVTVSDKMRRDPVAEGNCIDIKIHLGCTEEVDDFSATLWNTDYFTNRPLHVGMHVKIYGAREDGPLLKLFCGRCEKIRAVDRAGKGSTIVISGRSYGEELFRRNITKAFYNLKGEYIVKQLIENYTSLKHVRGSTELVESTDTTYVKLEFESESIFDILKHIAKTADKGGVIGFDFRITYDGKFEFFQRNSRTSPCTITDLLEEAEYTVDIHRIRNKIKVLGAELEPMPRNMDRWTEPGSDPPPYWQALTEGTYIARATSPVKVGTYSIKIYEENVYSWYPEVVRAITDEFGNPTEISLDSSKQVHLWVYRPSSSLYLWFRLYTSFGNYFEKDISGAVNDWTEYTFPLGKENESGWYKSGLPDWRSIAYVGVKGTWIGSSPKQFYLDGIYFTKIPYMAVQQDSGSINAYGLRELCVKDDELYSDEECRRRALALLDYYKSPLQTVVAKSSVLDPAGNRFLPGDKITVYLPKENVNSQFRIESVEHFFDGRNNEWVTTLTLGKEPPLLADYLYALKYGVQALAKTKLPRG